LEDGWKVLGNNKRLKKLGFCMALVAGSDNVACGDNKISLTE